MKIAFYVYPTAFQNPGGGEIQLLKTKQYLEQEGISVKLFDPWQDKLQNFDILHTFGSVKDALPMMKAARHAGIKNILSTICWYSWKSSWGASDNIKSRIGGTLRHFAKEFLPFIPSERGAMMKLADVLLPNSQSEADQLTRYFRVPDRKIKVIPNAVDRSFCDATPDLFVKTYGQENFILCVGRIEPRKNQLLMARALKNSSAKVFFVGDYVSQYAAYFEQCKKEAGKKTFFIGSFGHDSEMLKSAYAACHTFLLASWLETPGLAALEAGLTGANIVITREGATREYFKDFVLYTTPDDPNDIRNQTELSLRKNKTLFLKDHLLKNYSWENTVKSTLKAYEYALNS